MEGSTERVERGQRWLSGGAGEKDGGCVDTGCWLAALGTCRRRLRGGAGGQLAVGGYFERRMRGSGFVGQDADRVTSWGLLWIR